MVFEEEVKSRNATDNIDIDIERMERKEDINKTNGRERQVAKCQDRNIRNCSFYPDISTHVFTGHITCPLDVFLFSPFFLYQCFQLHCQTPRQKSSQWFSMMLLNIYHCLGLEIFQNKQGWYYYQGFWRADCHPFNVYFNNG